MKTLCSFLVVVLLAVSSSSVWSQSIRKDYREFTSQEMEDYRGALEAIRQSGIFDDFADHHDEHFNTEIHTFGGNKGEYFLPWHRFFLLDMEWALKNAGSQYEYLSVPYWDWRVDRNRSGLTGTTHWSNDFLSEANLPNFSFFRDFANQTGDGYLGTTAQIDACLALSAFWNNTTDKSTSSPDFSHRLESYHDFVHAWIGGTMNSGASPGDPVFYLHHNFIDKLWQDWEEQTSGLQSSFLNGAVAMPHYNTDDHYDIDVFANDMKDSRSITEPVRSPVSSRSWDVWFAYQGKVLLDGANNADFVCNDATTPYLYRYTAATTVGGSTVSGKMYVGDVKRDANDNVVSDDKGGFRIEPNVTCDFRAGGFINFRPGFRAKAGSKVKAKIISSPDGFRQGQDMEERVVSTTTNSLQLSPNPVEYDLAVRVTVPHSSVVSYSMYDMLGHRVYQSASQILSGGTHRFGIGCSDLASGTYLVSIVIDGAIETRTVVVQH